MRWNIPFCSCVLFGLVVVGCGGKSDVEKPSTEPAVPALKPTPAVDGPEAKADAIRLAAQFAQSKYPDKLMLSQPIATFVTSGMAPPNTMGRPDAPGQPPTSMAPGVRQTFNPGGGSSSFGAITPEQRTAMIKPGAKGVIPPPAFRIEAMTPPSASLRAEMDPHQARGSWRVAFRVIMAGHSGSQDPADLPVAVRFFRVTGKAVEEMEPLRLPTVPKIGP
jgi:hypothetical protein